MSNVLTSKINFSENEKQDEEKICKEENNDKEYEEYQYLRLIEKIIKTGSGKGNRTGVDTYSIFGTQMRFGLRDGKYMLYIIIM